MPAPRMSPAEIHARQSMGERILFVDARNPRAWAASDEKLPGAIRVEKDQVDDRAEDLARTGALIVAYCT